MMNVAEGPAEHSTRRRAKRDVFPRGLPSEDFPGKGVEIRLELKVRGVRVFLLMDLFPAFFANFLFWPFWRELGSSVRGGPH